MSFTDLFYEHPAAFEPPSATFVVKTAEAAEASEMETLVQAALDEIQAQNVLIAAAFPETPERQLTLGDFLLAGGGDGHTFVVTLVFVAQGFNGVQTLLQLGTGALLPENLSFKFGLGSEKDALAIAITDTITRAAAPEATRAIFQEFAGAAKGTRFMFGVGGILQQE
jgi:hypothetical protein